MAMPIGDCNDLNTVLHWAMGTTRWHGDQVSDEEATGAARNLAAKAYKALGAGLRPDEVILSRPITVAAHKRVMATIEMQRYQDEQASP